MNIQDTIKKNIDSHGVNIMAIGGTNTTPSFVYTTGLTDIGFPELIVFSLPPHAAHGIMYAIIEQVKASKEGVLEDGDIFNDVANLPVHIKAISAGAASHYAFQTLFYYKGQPVQPTFMQVVLCDPEGSMPWEDGYQMPHSFTQPELWKAEEAQVH